MKLIEKSFLQMMLRSWRCYNKLNVAITTDDFVVPIGNGVGRELFGEPHPIKAALEAIFRIRTGTFVDVGANVGHVLLTLARIDKKIPYIGFEPSLEAACHVQKLIDLNGLSATHSILPIALAESCGASILLMNDEADVSATITSEVRPPTMYRSSRPVSVSTGDIQLRDVEHIAAIKIDVEGAELQVLKGLEATLERHKPALIVEIMPTHHLENHAFNSSYFGDLPAAEIRRLIDNRQRHAETIFSNMSALGYTFFLRSEDSWQPAHPRDSTLENQDFLLIPADCSASFDAG
jgi:FkbM family methyltransferase